MQHEIQLAWQLVITLWYLTSLSNAKGVKLGCLFRLQYWRWKTQYWTENLVFLFFHLNTGRQNHWLVHRAQLFQKTCGICQNRGLRLWGKHLNKNLQVYLGIAQIAIHPPASLFKWCTLKPFFVVVFCHKPSWQGLWSSERQVNHH